MPVEQCSSCEAKISLADAVHLTINTKSDEGVVDYYVCRRCYEEKLAPALP